MSKKNKNSGGTSGVVSAGGGSAVLIEGLAASALAAELARREKSEAKRAVRAEKERDERIARLVELRDTKNPAILPDTVRPTTEGELIGGKAAKGWAVTICCETCSAQREVNTQDAFQVRFCSDTCKPTKSGGTKVSKEIREATKAMSTEELRAALEAAQQQAA